VLARGSGVYGLSSDGNTCVILESLKLHTAQQFAPEGIQHVCICTIKAQHTKTATCTRTAQMKSLVEIQLIKSHSFSVSQSHIYILPQLDIQILTKILQRILLVVISDEPSGDGPVDVLPGIRGRVKI
jgi:hypothetical protein